MFQDKYFIHFDWRAPNGKYIFCEHWGTSSFLKFIVKFIMLSFKYDIIDVEYRYFRE